MSSDFTSLMKKKYGVTKTSKLTFTINDTLFSMFRKLAKNIYKNGDWTEKDEIAAVETIAQKRDKFTELLDRPNYIIRKANDDEISIHEVTDRFSQHIKYIAEPNGTEGDLPQHILLDRQNKSIKDSGQSYYFKYNHTFDIKRSNLDLAIGYDKLSRDILKDFNMSSLYINSTEEEKVLLKDMLGTKLTYLMDSSFASGRNARIFRQLSTNPDDFSRNYSADFFREIDRSNKILDYISSYITNTYDIVLQSEYAKNTDKQFRARAWFPKKNINQSTLELMKTTSLNEYYSDIELDNDVDLLKFQYFETEMSKLQSILPKGIKQPILRLRKLGNYKALGMFHPVTNTIIVDFRDGQDNDHGYAPSAPGIQSFIHEYAHYLDYNVADTNLSMTDEFQDIVRRYRENLMMLDSESDISSKQDYYGTPTEVFARIFEIYVSEKGLKSSFIKSKESYIENDEYRIVDQFMKEKAFNFFDNRFPELVQRIISFNQGVVENQEIAENKQIYEEIPLNLEGSGKKDTRVLNTSDFKSNEDETVFKKFDHEELEGIGVDIKSNRIYITTKSKPSLETRTLLKAGGMLWAPKKMRWQTVLNRNTITKLNETTLAHLSLGVVKDYFPNIDTQAEVENRDTKIHVSKGQKINTDMIDNAKQADILDFASKMGIDFYQVSSDEYRLKEHDSCVIKSSKNLFYWNSQQIYGGVIDFAMNFTVDQSLPKNEKFKTAVKQINNLEVGRFIDKPIIHEPFQYNRLNVSTDFSKAKEYLVNVRDLDSELVDQLHKLGYIQQNKQGNVEFAWLDPATRDVVGVSEQGTEVNFNKFSKRGTLKKIQKNSTANYGFSFTFGNPENIMVFESSIDALSYASLNRNILKNTRLVSMEGLKPQVALNYISITLDETKKMPKSFKICVDNDTAGDKFIEKMQKYQLHDRKTGQIVNFEVDRPTQGKDWNEFLQNKDKSINPKQSVAHRTENSMKILEME